MRVCFRTDASNIIGTGHVMRCLCLAHELRKQGTEVHFICANLQGNFAYIIEQQGFTVHSINDHQEPCDDTTWLLANWQESSIDTINIIKDFDQPFDWLVVDHYGICEEYYNEVRPHVGSIMAIDDLANRTIDCDILLDQNWIHTRKNPYTSLVPKHCKMLLGPDYVLLRDEFTTIEPSSVIRSPGIQNILIFFGGSDIDNLTGMALEVLQQDAYHHLNIHVVVGYSNPRKHDILELCEATPHFNFHFNIDYMSQLMTECDLAIGGGGGTHWERLYLGLPAIVVSLADNQNAICESLRKRGLVYYLGRHVIVKQDDIKQALDKAIMDYSWHQKVHTEGPEIVSHWGAKKIIAHMRAMNLSFRLAKTSDLERLDGWNYYEGKINAPDKPQDPEDYKKWVYEVVSRHDRMLLIAKVYNNYLGLVRFDLTPKDAHIIIALHPEFQGRNLSLSLLIAAQRWLKKHQPLIRKVYASIDQADVKSVRIFSYAGFEELDDISHTYTQDHEETWGFSF